MEGCSQRLLCSIGQWLEATSSFHGKLRPESSPEPALGVLQNHNDGAVDPKFGATGKVNQKSLSVPWNLMKIRLSCFLPPELQLHPQERCV